MANEIHWDTTTGLTLYFCAFQPDGNVFLTGGASDEAWGTGGGGSNDADDYDETMTEDGAGGHYVGSFAAGQAAGRYQIAIYRQGGANPADTDMSIARGEILWDGTSEIHRADEDDITDAHTTTDALIVAQVAAQKTVYDET